MPSKHPRAFLEKIRLRLTGRSDWMPAAGRCTKVLRFGRHLVVVCITTVRQWSLCCSEANFIKPTAERCSLSLHLKKRHVKLCTTILVGGYVALKRCCTCFLSGIFQTANATASPYLQEASYRLWLWFQRRSKIQVCCMFHCIIKIFGTSVAL